MGLKRINRSVDLTAENESIVHQAIAPWSYKLQCKFHGEIEFNFEKFRRNDREPLAAEMRDAIWSLRNETTGRTLQEYLPSALIRFWNFLDYLDTQQQKITKLSQIDDVTIRQFIVWLDLQISASGNRKGMPWLISTRVGAYLRMKALLINRQKLAPEKTNPKLKFPKNPYPRSNHLTTSREPYSETETNRILKAINLDLLQLDSGICEPMQPLLYLTIHVLAIALTTGRNPQSILDMKRGCLRAHPLGDREILITEKRKGYSTQVSSYKTSQNKTDSTELITTIPKSVGDYVRAIQEYTKALSLEADPSDREYILLLRMRRNVRKNKIVRFTSKKFRQAAIVFVNRHSLVDDQGAPLNINLARCRPTFGTKLYSRTGDIRKVQQALGHSNPDITAKHYIKLPSEAIRNHAFVGHAMVGHFTARDPQLKQAFAADGKIPLQKITSLLDGGYNTVIARCKNPFRDGGQVCGKYLSCFRCPQMVVFEDDLWRLYSFYYKLLFEKIKINPNDWLETYGPVINVIDLEISKEFPKKIVEEAKEKARRSPHPAWPRGDVL